ncbi:RluA family pseudouridine synthase [Anaerocolumna sp. MB42-C2]|uniref:RluA family pseudouridine synthase n=1 Tax=Anaerocolumna sp. MB42-C2 TaxID=3070997 RepID=UPI0027DFA4BC|nr:RluA family pseudouridine synthase [Anaerocolumna sp. MB42-C2]WMJ88399.1 RluA family pseudouridine synthase [Anaerocolumna sp. MB42-C2]
MKIITVDKNEAGQRLDKLLLKQLNKAPKSFIYKMLRKKNITLNGKKADGSEKTQLNDEIKLFLSEETIENFSESFRTTIVEYDFTVVYEDSNILVVNKPAGLLSQKAVKDDVSLVEHIISYLLSKGEINIEELQTFKPGVCNRLDRNTSGLVVAGKTLQGLQTMSELFRERTLDKFYLCIVKGTIKEFQKITGYLKKDEKTNKVSITDMYLQGSEPIQTEYQPIRYNDKYTLLKVKLITGKTHQIRAHLSSIGHPIAGDGKYGNKMLNAELRKEFGLEHQLLHAYQLIFPQMYSEFEDLSGKELIAKVPDYFQNIQNTLL